MNGKLILAVAVALVAALTASASAASPTLYVGDTKEYAIAFKDEGEQLYVIELAGPTDCYYSEPHEDLGPGFFNVFAVPTLMRGDSEGLHAYDFGLRIRAERQNEAVIGDFHYSESELSYHCDTGFEPKPFQANRYQPAGHEAVPVSGERPVYYGSEASTEVFLRAGEKEVFGIRGTFTPRCRVGRQKQVTGPRALFSDPAFAKLRPDRSFETEDVEEGTTRSGVRYRERISLTGAADQGAVSGTYLRVRTTRPGRKSQRRCVTGPLPFRAIRYLPALG